MAALLPVNARRAGLALALAAASTAPGWVRSRVRGTEICTYWPVRSVPFWLHRDGTPDIAGGDEFPVMRTSFATWTGPPCTDLLFLDRGLTDENRVGYDPERTPLNVLVFRAKACNDVVPASDPCLGSGGCRNIYACWEGPPGAIALTTTTYSTRTGEIFDADIEFNDADRHFAALASECVGATCADDDLENTATHEIGHVIGFDHDPEAESTMYASAAAGEIKKRNLSAEDVKGLCTVYPRGKPAVPCVTPPERVVVGGCACAGGHGTALAALVPFTFLALRGGGSRRAGNAGRGRRPGSP